MKMSKFSYISWKLDVDRDDIQKFDISFTDRVDIVSQYWIVNNISGVQIEFNPEKVEDYNINVLKWVEDSIYVYPISTLHYLIE